jgi:hypothetical protein
VLRERLELAKRIITVLPEGSSGSKTRGSVLRNVDKTYGSASAEPSLPLLLISEIEVLQRSVAASRRVLVWQRDGASDGEGAQWVVDFDAAFRRQVSWTQADAAEAEGALSRSLDFLSFVLREAGWKLKHEALRRLWRACFDRATSPAVAQAFVTWVETVLPQQRPGTTMMGETLTDDAAAELLFREVIVPAVDRGHLLPAPLDKASAADSPPALWFATPLEAVLRRILTALFRALNVRNKGLSLLASGASRTLQPPSKLIGIEALWRAATRGCDASARDEAASILLDVYLTINPRPAMDHTCRGAWIDFVDRCVLSLLPAAICAAPAAADDAGPRVVENVEAAEANAPLQMLLRFLSRLASLGPIRGGAPRVPGGDASLDAFAPATGSYLAGSTSSSSSGSHGGKPGASSIAHLIVVQSRDIGWEQVPSGALAKGKMNFAVTVSLEAPLPGVDGFPTVATSQSIRHRMQLDAPATIGDVRKAVARCARVPPTRVRLKLDTVADSILPAELDSTEVSVVGVGNACKATILRAPASDTLAAGAEDADAEDAAERGVDGDSDADGGVGKEDAGSGGRAQGRAQSRRKGRETGCLGPVDPQGALDWSVLESGQLWSLSVGPLRLGHTFLPPHAAQPLTWPLRQ